MAATKQQKIIYRVVTALFLLPMAGSGFPELVVGGPEQTANTVHDLGYPAYLLRMLGLAKILGAAAIVANRWRALKEWAYAGYTFDLLGAVVSHLITGVPTWIAPGSVLVLEVASYALWRRTRYG